MENETETPPELETLDREAIRKVALTHDLDLVVLFRSPMRERWRADSPVVAIRSCGPWAPRLSQAEECRVSDALSRLLKRLGAAAPEP